MRDLRSEYKDWHEDNMRLIKQRYMHSFVRYIANAITITAEITGYCESYSSYRIDGVYDISVWDIESDAKYSLDYIGDTSSWGGNGVSINCGKGGLFYAMSKVINQAYHTHKNDTQHDNIKAENISQKVTKEDLHPKPKPCSVYVQELISPNIKAMKYGVANAPEVRMKDQSSKSLFKHTLIHEVLLPTRHEALALEKAITKEFWGYYCEKPWMPDGYTETLAHDKIDDVIKFIKNYMQEFIQIDKE